MSQRTKKQHYVPRFYLDKFADADGFIWNYGVDGVVSPRKATDTAVETNFYSPADAEGKRFDEGEAMLAEIESSAAPLWETVVSGDVVEGGDREIFSMFLAAQYLRSPSMVRAGAEMAGMLASHTAQVLTANKASSDKMFDEIDASEDTFTSEEEREKLRRFFRDPNNITVNVLKSAGLPVLGSIEPIASMICHMKWVVGRSRSQHIVTSDCPVTRVSDPSTYHPVYGDGGFANKSVRIQFPLDPSHVLEAAWKGTERDRIADIPKKMAREINSRRAYFAENYLYSSVEDQGIQKLSAKYLSASKSPLIKPGQPTSKVNVKRKL